MTLSSTAARGAAATLAGQWMKFLLQSLALFILARLLAPQDFGIYTMVMAFVGAGLLLSEFGLSMASIQSESISHAQRSNLFWVNLLVGLMSALAVFFLAESLEGFYGDSRLGDVARCLSIVLLIQSASAQFIANASRHFRFRLLAWTDIAAQACALIVAIVVAARGFTYWALVFQQVTVAAVTLIIVVATSKWWPGRPRRGVPMRQFFVFGANTTGVQAVNYVSANVDSVMLGRFSGAAELGIYDRAFQVFRLPLQQVAAPMTRVALPILSRITDPEKFDKYIQRAQLGLTYSLGGIFAVAISMSDPLLRLILGPGWGDAPMIFSILAVGGLFQAMGYVYYWIFLAKGRTGLQLKFSIVGRTGMVLLILLGVQWGAVGTAIGVSTGLFLNWAILTMLAIPRTGVRVQGLLHEALAPLCLYIVMVGITYPVTIWLGAFVPDIALAFIALAACVLIFALIYLLIPRVRRDVGGLVVIAQLGLSKR